MWPFRRKNTYLITWSYGEHHADVGMKYSDFIRAHDIGQAWAKLKKEHPLPIYMISIEKVNQYD